MRKFVWFFLNLGILFLIVMALMVINLKATTHEMEPQTVAACKTLDGVQVDTGIAYAGSLSPPRLNYSYLDPFGGLTLRVLVDPGERQEYLLLNGQYEPPHVEYIERTLGHVRFRTIQNDEAILQKCG